MKKPNMFGVLLTTASFAALALAAWPAWGQDAKEILTLDSFNENLKVEDGNVWLRQQGRRWEQSLPGTVGNAVKELRQLFPDATIAVDPIVASAPVTDVIVRANDPATALQALRVACGEKFIIDTWTNSLYTLVANPRKITADGSTQDDRIIECFNLGGYLSDDIVRDHEEETQAQVAGHVSHTAAAVSRLQDIIEHSIADLDTSISQPGFRFYPDAELFIVTGSPRAIKVAAKIIRALPGQKALMEQDAQGQDAHDYESAIHDYQKEFKQFQAYMKAMQAGHPPSAPAPENNPTNHP